MVISHCCKEKVFQAFKNQDEAKLGEAATVADGFALCLNVHQLLEDCSGAETGE